MGAELTRCIMSCTPTNDADDIPTDKHNDAIQTSTTKIGELSCDFEEMEISQMIKPNILSVSHNTTTFSITSKISMVSSLNMDITPTISVLLSPTPTPILPPQSYAETNDDIFNATMHINDDKNNMDNIINHNQSILRYDNDNISNTD
eukprot:390035_1